MPGKSRSIRTQAGNQKMATPSGLDPAGAAAFNRVARLFRSPAFASSTPPGRRTGSSPSSSPARQENTRRESPASPKWISFAGGGGSFRGVFKMPATTTDQGSLEFELQLASNSTFTTDLTSFSNIGRSFMVFMPNFTRFARVRARYFDSPWGGWRAYGSPSSVSSGVLPLTAVAAGTPTGTGTTTTPQPAPPPSDPVDSPTDDEPLDAPSRGG